MLYSNSRFSIGLIFRKLEFSVFHWVFKWQNIWYPLKIMEGVRWPQWDDVNGRSFKTQFFCSGRLFNVITYDSIFSGEFVRIMNMSCFIRRKTFIGGNIINFILYYFLRTYLSWGHYVSSQSINPNTFIYNLERVFVVKLPIFINKVIKICAQVKKF